MSELHPYNGNINGLKVSIHPGDHAPPHAHVRLEKGKAGVVVINLLTLEHMYANKTKPAVRKRASEAIEAVKAEQGKLMTIWNDLNPPKHTPGKAVTRARRNPDAGRVHTGSAHEITSARIEAGALEVVFGDGLSYHISQEVAAARWRAQPVRVRVIDSGDAVKISLDNGDWTTAPWDGLRYECDPAYKAQADAEAAKSRETVRSRLCRRREVRGWTQAQLAERAGISRVTLSRVETGAQDPSLNTLQALAKAYGVTLSELLAAPG